MDNATWIDPLSLSSVHLEVFARGNKLSGATGFIVTHKAQHYLVTAWHVLAGRNSHTNKCLHPSAAIPDEVQFGIRKKNPNNIFQGFKLKLRDEGDSPLWLEHVEGRGIDVAVLPISIPEIDILLLSQPNLAPQEDELLVEPGMAISIIGYPYNMSGGWGWPIWITGFIATEPDIGFWIWPKMLVNATAREGMSGAPVFAKQWGNYRMRSQPGIRIAGGVATRFLGVYSGRIREDAELCNVWYPETIIEIIERRKSALSIAMDEQSDSPQ